MEILLIIPGFILSVIIVVIYEIKLRKPKNNVHFYIVKDKNEDLTLWIGKPKRNLVSEEWYGYNPITCITTNKNITLYNLNQEDYANLKWEDEPIEVFLNLKK